MTRTSHKTPCRELVNLKKDTDKAHDKIDKKLNAILSEMGYHKGKINTILQLHTPFWRNPDKVIVDNPGTTKESVFKDRIINILLKTISIMFAIILILLGMKSFGVL